MSKRYWELKCQECDNNFWREFENLHNNGEVMNFVEVTKCESCDSAEWIFTGKTRIKETEKEVEKIMLHCDSCKNYFFTQLKNKNPANLREMSDSLECPTCEKVYWRVTDATGRFGSSDPQMDIPTAEL